MKKPYVEIILAGEVFYLLPEKAMFRPRKNQLILSDVHLGKATHFRKQGIALPANSHLKDLDKLRFLLNTWKPASVLILGDLFHSDYNNEWLLFKLLLKEYSLVKFILTEGNHDILKDNNYEIKNLLKIKMLEEDHFIFSHHPLNKIDKINFCGHIHPGIKIKGMAKQFVKLPCFYFNGGCFILPAFGDLTGLHLLEYKEEASYFLVKPGEVIKL